MRVPSPWMCEGGYSYSYSYSSRWDHGVESRAGHVGSSTSTALRAEYEYEYGRDPGSRHQEGAEHRQTIAHGVSRGMGFTNWEEPRMGRKRTVGSRRVFGFCRPVRG